jgi:hypothetical protein
MGMLLHHLQTAPTPPNLARPDLDIPAPLIDVLMRALQKDREQRYASATEMVAALDQVAALPLPEAPPLEWPAVPVMTPPPVRTPSGAPTPRPLTPTELAQIEAQPTKMMPSTPTPAPTTMQGAPTLLQQPPLPPRRRPWWQWVAASGVIVFAMCSGLCARVCDRHDEKPPAPPAPEVAGGEGSSAGDLLKEGLKEAMQDVADETIQEAVEERLAASRATAEHDLSVKVKDGVVTLRGKVPSATASQVAEALAETVPGVTEVRNEIRAPKESPGTHAVPRPDMVPPPGKVMPVPPAPRAPGVPPVDPKSPEGQALQELLKRGREAMAADHPEIAIRHYGAALSLDPGNEEANKGMEKAAAAMATSWTRRLPFPYGPPSGRPHPSSPTASPTPEP